MLGVRRGRGDVRVATRGIEAETGEPRRVVGVDDVVRQSGMIGELLKQRIENLGGALLPRERRIGLGRGLDQRERVVNRHLGIVGQIVVETRQRIGRRLQPPRVGNRVRAAIERGSRREESPLAWRRRAQRDRTLGRRGAAAQRLTPPHGTAGPTRERIAPRRERQSPVRHRARRVGLGDRLKCRLSLIPPERMQQGHGVLEPLLCRWIAGDRKNHSTQMVVLSG